MYISLMMQFTINCRLKPGGQKVGRDFKVWLITEVNYVLFVTLMDVTLGHSRSE